MDRIVGEAGVGPRQQMRPGYEVNGSRKSAAFEGENLADGLHEMHDFAPAPAYADHVTALQAAIWERVRVTGDQYYAMQFAAVGPDATPETEQ
jgi:hypothetical protein